MKKILIKINKIIKYTSQLDHLQAKWIQTQATIVGLYWRHIVVKCKLFVAIKYDVWARSLLANYMNNNTKNN